MTIFAIVAATAALIGAGYAIYRAYKDSATAAAIVEGVKTTVGVVAASFVASAATASAAVAEPSRTFDPTDRTSVREVYVADIEATNYIIEVVEDDAVTEQDMQAYMKPVPANMDDKI